MSERAEVSPLNFDRALLVPVCQSMVRESRCSDVAALGRVVAAAEDMLQHYARLAKANGSTWAELGAQLGITRQAAQQRFGRS